MLCVDPIHIIDYYLDGNTDFSLDKPDVSFTWPSSNLMISREYISQSGKPSQLLFTGL